MSAAPDTDNIPKPVIKTKGTFLTTFILLLLIFIFLLSTLYFSLKNRQLIEEAKRRDVEYSVIL